MGNVDGISGRGANMVEVGSESGVDGGVGEVLLHHAKCYAWTLCIVNTRLEYLQVSI